MPSELEYQTAYYIGDDGTRVPIDADELADNAKFDDAGARCLTDVTGQRILHPRRPKGRRRHFYAVGGTLRRLLESTEREDEAHQNRIDKHLTALQEQTSFTLQLRERTNGLDSWSRKLRLTGYVWGTEVYRVLPTSAVVRHDIFGHCINPGMSVLSPWIAIEVVNTHFPEEEAFQAWLDLSAAIPFMVIFDLVQRSGVFVDVLPKSSAIAYSRWTYYIFEGAVWKGASQTNIRTSDALAREVRSMLERWDQR